MKKFIIAVFSLFLVIIFVELFFFFSISQKKFVPNTTTNLTNQTLQPTPSNKEDLFINLSLNAFRKRLVTGFVKSALLTIVYQGTINSLDFKGGLTPINQLKYSTKITIQNEDKKTDFYFDAPLLAKTKVFNDSKQISIDKLQVGDQITIESSYDLTKIGLPHNVVSVSITKLASQP